MNSLATIMALVRGLHLAATLSLLGTAGFIAWMLPAAGAVPDPLRRRLTRLCRTSGLVAAVSGVAWFGLQAAILDDAKTLSDGLAALPLVALHTRFGNVLMIRIAMLAVATLLCARPRLAVIFSALALGLQGFVGHAGAAGGAIGDSLVVSEALHLLAAGLWLGSLIPLWLSLRILPPVQAAAVCERFSPIGLGCVLVLTGTGFVQGLQLIGSLPALLGTPYGHIGLLKIVLFLAALTLAAVNRLWLTDRLASRSAGARRRLLISVSVEALLGLAIVTAAAVLASNVPAVHSDPVWPFSWQFSLVAVNADPDLRREVIVSLLLIGGAILLLAAAMLWHRFRLVALGLLAAMILLRGPSLKLLRVEAYPTSFQTSPSGFTAESIAYGRELFARNCVDCHGPEADGNGPAAAGLRIKPADLTMPHVQQHSDGALFWWLTMGIADPEGRPAMPGFAASLSPDDRWALIDYVRARNASVAMQQDSAFDIAVPAPAFAVSCDGVAASATADLGGRAVHVIIGRAAMEQPWFPAQSGISAVTLVVPSAERAASRPPPGTCVAVDPSAWNAYAVLADLPPDKVAGSEFLIDPNGWLRAVRGPGATGGWHSDDGLLAAIRVVSAHPIAQPPGGQHEHHH